MLAASTQLVRPVGHASSSRQRAAPAAAAKPLSQLRGAHGAQQLASPLATRRLRAVRSQTVRVSAIFGGLQKLINGDPSEKTRDKYQSTVAKINAFAAATAELSDEQLRAKTTQFKNALASGAALDSILPEAFAVAREASDRVLGLRPFDVQLIGGLILHEGQIAEMRTGEGKTLVAVLPAYLNALTGKGVHVVTVNDYLARRDCEWVGQVHRFLGLTVGLVQQGMSEKDRQAAYASDVTYVTNSEVGFDYLRDNLATALDELVLRREFNFCVIDEVDSILIDEARTPLIISGPADKPSDRYLTAAKVADAFQKGVHYKVDEKQRSVVLTEEGYEAAEELLQVKDLYDPRTQWALYIINALKAKELQKKDVNYIVKSGEVIIVDEFTGRTMVGRRWSDGLHQAVEAKEGVAIQNETITIASVTYQSFFRNYKKLSGMTGTAATEVTEFGTIYNLIVQVVPTNRSNSRADSPDVVFRLGTAKWNAVVTEVTRMHKKGRPVLVGTTSVEQSETLSALLTEKGIAHEVLNAKPENVQREAEIVAQSGRVGGVTISTNMAGRGTDILLGGNPEYMARLKIRENLMPKIVLKEDDEISFEKRGKTGVVDTTSRWRVDPKIYPVELTAGTKSLVDAAVRRAVNKWGEKSIQALEAEDRLSLACEKGPLEDDVLLGLRVAFEEVLGEYKKVTDEERNEVRALGGLHVVGTERHESRRIDNQLRGRAGRQGDPGSTRFFLSLEDNLFRIFGGDRVQALMQAFRVEDLPIESSMLSSSLDEAQKKVETYFYDIRKQLFEYDQVLNSQREKVYAERRKALRSDQAELSALMVEYAELTIDDICAANLDQSADQSTWDFEALDRKLKQYCPQMADLTPAELKAKASAGGFEGLRGFLRERGKTAYMEKAGYVEGRQAGLMAEAERYFILSQTDSLWKEHLQAIKFVQQAVGLRGYAQRDPLIEYKLEGYNLFVEMMAQIRRNVIYSVLMFEFKRAEGAAPEAGAAKPALAAASGAASAAGAAGAAEKAAEKPKAGAGGGKSSGKRTK